MKNQICWIILLSALVSCAPPPSDNSHPMGTLEDSIHKNSSEITKKFIKGHKYFTLSDDGYKTGEVFMMKIRKCDYIFYAAWQSDGGRAIIHAADCNNLIHKRENQNSSSDIENSFTIDSDEEY